MEICGRQKVAINFLFRFETQTKIFVRQVENSGRQFSFKNQNKTERVWSLKKQRNGRK